MRQHRVIAGPDDLACRDRSAFTRRYIGDINIAGEVTADMAEIDDRTVEANACVIFGTIKSGIIKLYYGFFRFQECMIVI